MSVLLPAIIPVAFIIIIGFIAGRTLNLESQTLSQLTVYILAPALVADSLYRTNIPLKSATGLLIGVFLIALVLYLLVWGFSRWFNLSNLTCKSLIATTLHPNNGNMGLPLINFALGAAGLERAIIYMIGSSIILFGIAPALLSGNSFKDSLKLIFKLPLIWAMLAGLLLRFYNIELPFKLGDALEMLGQAAIPIALIILGMELANTRLSLAKYELISTFLRLLIGPLVALAIGQFLHLQGLDLQVLIIQSAMPTAVNTLVLVAEFGGDTPRVARTILVTTLLSFLTLPMILWASAQLS